MGDRADGDHTRIRCEERLELCDEGEVAEEVGAHHEVESVARARRPIGSLHPGVADDRVELLVHLCGRPGHAVEGAEVERQHAQVGAGHLAPDRGDRGPGALGERHPSSTRAPRVESCSAHQ